MPRPRIWQIPPFVVYYVTDCQDQLYGPDRKPTGAADLHKAGTVRAGPIVSAHTAENVGAADCHEIFVERNRYTNRGAYPVRGSEYFGSERAD